MDGKLQASVVLFPGGGGPQIGGCDDVTSRLDGVEKKKEESKPDFQEVRTKVLSL